jgi:hypothetical protein
VVIGTTTPLAGAFTTLNASGLITCTRTSSLCFFSNGATTSESYGAIVNGGGGLYFGVESSAGGIILGGTSAYAGVVGTFNNKPVEIVSNNAKVASFSSTGLAVTGTLSATGTFTQQGSGLSTGGYLAISSATNTDTVIKYGANTGSAPNLAFKNDANTQVMTLNSSGNLGIGNTAPTGNLHIGNGTTVAEQNLYVQSDSANRPYLRLWSGTSSKFELSIGSTADINSVNAIPIVFATTNIERMRIAAGGAVSVVGSLSKGSGSFLISHPLPELNETHNLVHSFIEGPQADLIYRGRVVLVAGKATINIDTAATMTEGTFELLCGDVQCFTSNETDWNHVRGSVEGNILTIECQDTASVATISWMVIGERKDQHMLDTEWTDDNGKVIVEPLKPIPLENTALEAK